MFSPVTAVSLATAAPASGPAAPGGDVATTGRARVIGSGSRPHLNTATDVLVDAITGAGRTDLEGQPQPVVYALLCRQLRAMGLEPDSPKVRRVAAWISSEDPTERSATAGRSDA